MAPLVSVGVSQARRRDARHDARVVQTARRQVDLVAESAPRCLWHVEEHKRLRGPWPAAPPWQHELSRRAGLLLLMGVRRFICGRGRCPLHMRRPSRGNQKDADHARTGASGMESCARFAPQCACTRCSIHHVALDSRMSVDAPGTSTERGACARPPCPAIPGSARGGSHAPAARSSGGLARTCRCQLKAHAHPTTHEMSSCSLRTLQRAARKSPHRCLGKRPSGHVRWWLVVERPDALPTSASRADSQSLSALQACRPSSTVDRKVDRPPSAPTSDLTPTTAPLDAASPCPPCSHLQHPVAPLGCFLIVAG